MEGQFVNCEKKIHFFSQESINFTPPLILGVKSNL